MITEIERKVLQFEYDQIDKKLNPEVFVPTELQIMEARFRIFAKMIETPIWQSMYYYNFVNLPDDEKEKVRVFKQDMALRVGKEAHTFSEKYYQFLTDRKNKDHEHYRKEMWQMPEVESQLQYKLDSLSATHCGDCVSLPCSCSRCWAEDAFGRTPTDTWTQAEGMVMWDRYHELAKLLEVKPTVTGLD